MAGRQIPLNQNDISLLAKYVQKGYTDAAVARSNPLCGGTFTMQVHESCNSHVLPLYFIFASIVVLFFCFVN